MDEYTVYLRRAGGYLEIGVNSETEPASHEPGWITVGKARFQSSFVAAIVPEAARSQRSDKSSRAGGVLLVPEMDAAAWAAEAARQQAELRQSKRKGEDEPDQST